uniref:Uncharacterized protein n=1 Tax=Anguilla anguilla TaxID=7936 RepID=A0A0E9XBA9_ANGAN
MKTYFCFPFVSLLCWLEMKKAVSFKNFTYLLALQCFCFGSLTWENMRGGETSISLLTKKSLFILVQSDIYNKLWKIVLRSSEF